MEQKFTLGTVVSGALNVTIERVGSFGFIAVGTSLQACAGNVYACLTRQPVFDDGDFFEFVSFDPDKGNLVVKVNKK